MTQPPLTLRNDGHDDLRIKFYNLRESSLAFGMSRDEFNTLAALTAGDRSPASWLASGKRVHRAAMDAWTRDELVKRERRIQARRDNLKSFRDEAERRKTRFRQMDEAAAARRPARA